MRRGEEVQVDAGDLRGVAGVHRVAGAGDLLQAPPRETGDEPFRGLVSQHPVQGRVGLHEQHRGRDVGGLRPGPGGARLRLEVGLESAVLRRAVDGGQGPRGEGGAGGAGEVVFQGA